MVYRAVILLSLLLAAGCGGHGKESAAATAGGNPAGGAASGSVARDAAAGEGPRITLSQDNVHIEYRVYGQGDPAVLLVHGWACQ